MKTSLRGIARNRFLLFSLVGGVATALQFTLLFLFVELDWLGEVPASALSFAIAAVANYLMNYHLTFGSSQSHARTFPKFAAVASFGLLLNVSIFSLFLLVVHYLLAQAIATLITLCTNFLLHKYWIYRRTE